MISTHYSETHGRLPRTSAGRKRMLSWMAVLLLGSVYARPCLAHDQFFGQFFSHEFACDDDAVCFDMVPSTDAASCLPHAHGRVTITPEGPVEKMTVDVSGLPKNTEFDFFVIQVPNAPFGLSWYQGDIDTDEFGMGHGRFVGRFNTETFIVAPNVAPAPIVHDDPPNPDAAQNPKTAPVHTFHLGLWFNSHDDAAAAGCSNKTTPFNGDHNAGLQVLSTRNFADDQGPLRQLVP